MTRRSRKFRLTQLLSTIEGRVQYSEWLANEMTIAVLDDVESAIRTNRIPTGACECDHAYENGRVYGMESLLDYIDTRDVLAEKETPIDPPEATYSDDNLK